MSAAAPLHILIDPGHGGKDKGAVKGHWHESEIALKVAKNLAALLKQDPRFKVSMTRTGDNTLSLEKRTEIANETKADLFLSIHLNSSKDPRAHGKEFYFQNQLPVDEEAMFIANRENMEEEGASINGSMVDAATRQNERLSPQTDLRRILEDLHRNERIFLSNELSKVLYETWSSTGRKSGSRAIRQAPFFVVSNVKIPSVLIELGFLSHPTEGPQLAQESYQSELAKSLYTGLTKFKETMDKDPTTPLHSANAN